MELNIIFFCTTIGALVGTMVGVLLMNRKIRLPISAADLAALRGKLDTAESSLAAANSSLEELRKQVGEREQAVQQHADDLKKRQEQLDLAAAQAEKEKTQRCAAEQKAQEFDTQLSTLKEHRAQLESRLEEEKRRAAEEQEIQKRQIQTLTDQVDGLIAESAAMSRFREQESRHRSALEVQLNTEQERVDQLNLRIAELENERSQFDIKLQDERQSAARGMELLLMAQENFSRVLQPVPPVNGDDRHIVKAVGPSFEPSAVAAD